MPTTKTTKTKLNKYAPCKRVKSPMSCKLLYKMLTDIFDGDGQVVLSQREISGTLGISPSTVSRGMKKLKKSRLIYAIPQYDDCGKRMPNMYKMRNKPPSDGTDRAADKSP